MQRVKIVLHTAYTFSPICHKTATDKKCLYIFRAAPIRSFPICIFLYVHSCANVIKINRISKATHYNRIVRESNRLWLHSVHKIHKYINIGCILY